MSPGLVRLSAVLADLERDWSVLLRQLERAERVEPSTGDAEAALVALALDHAYQALEQILLRFERALSLPDRAGDTRHRRLLADAARPMPGVRPALVAPSAEPDWAELLGFRQFVRHAYAAELDAARLRALVVSLKRGVAATEPVIRAAFASLDPSLGE
jgi:hypothetical protein